MKTAAWRFRTGRKGPAGKPTEFFAASDAGRDAFDCRPHPRHVPVFLADRSRLSALAFPFKGRVGWGWCFPLDQYALNLYKLQRTITPYSRNDDARRNA